MMRRQITRVEDQHDRGTAAGRVNAALAVGITRGVGTMWCAYLFTALALVGLPGAFHAGVNGVVQWVAQTFLQLVLLSIIMVGQRVQGRAADKRAIDTYDDTESILRHLVEQDVLLLEAVGHLRATRPVSGSGAGQLGG